MNVLTVEDDATLAAVIDRNLRARGHVSRKARTAEDALLQMMEEWPDALILDVNLPDYSAWEVLRRLGSESRAALRVVVMSAAPISTKRLQEFGPHGVLRKPFVIGSLLHLLEGQPEEESAAEERQWT